MTQKTTEVSASAFEPNTTQVPNFIFEMIPGLSEAELKLLMIIIRKTYGWHKGSDKISTGQLESLTGLSYSAIKKARASLQRKGVALIKYKGNGRAITEYCRPHPVHVEEPVDAGGSSWGPPGCPVDVPQGGHKEASTKDTLYKRHLEQKEEPASPPLSLKSEPDTKNNVAIVKAKFLELAGKGGRWGAKQTKVAQSLLNDFSPDHVCENLKLLKEECIAKRGQYGWAFSMDKLTWKWEDLETIKEAEDAELLAEMKRLFPDYVPKSERRAI